MTCCDICGKELKSALQVSEVIVERVTDFNYHYDRYTLCSKCSKKINKFINFERARNNKRRCEND